MNSISSIGTTSISTYVPRAQALDSHTTKDFDDMVCSRAVAREDNQSLVEEELLFASEVRKTIDCLEITKGRLQQFNEEICSYDFSHAQTGSVLHDSKLPFIAMDALRKGFLHPEWGALQAATSLNFWGTVQDQKRDFASIKTVALFEGVAANPLAETLIKQTLTVRPLNKHHRSTPFLDGEKFPRFMAMMRKLPVSEQQFLLVPDLQGVPSDTWTEEQIAMTTVSQAMYDTNSFNVFSRVTHLEKALRIVPSFGMMQAFLRCQYDEPVTIKPRIYKSTEMQIRECGLTHTRDAMLPFPDKEGARTVSLELN